MTITPFKPTAVARVREARPARHRCSFLAEVGNRLFPRTWGRGAAGRDSTTLLQVEKERDADLSTEILTPGEQGVVGVASATALGHVLQARHLFGRMTDNVVRAKRQVIEVAEKESAYLVNYGDEIVARREHQERDTAKDLVADSPTLHVNAVVLKVVELAITAAELTFWYVTFSRDIDRSVPLLSAERLSAALLALFISSLGIVASRFAGASLASLIHGNKPESVRKDRALWIAASASVLFFIAAAVVTFALVHWRYDESVSFGAIEMPAVWLAFVFVSMLAILTGIRGFALDHEDAGRRRRRKTLDRLQEGAETLRADIERRQTRWHQATVALERSVAATLDTVESDLLTGMILIAESRALRSDGPGALQARKSPTPQLPVDLDGLVATLHGIECAVLILARHGAAPDDAAATLQRMVELRARVIGLKASTSVADADCAK